METVLETSALTEGGAEIRRSRRLRGNLSLGGDAHFSLLATGIAALGEEPSRLENLPETPWFREFRAGLESLGAVFVQAPDGHWRVSAALEWRAPEFIPVSLELSALILAGIAAGKGFAPRLEFGPSIPEETVAFLQSLYPEGGSPSPIGGVCKPFEQGWPDGQAKVALGFQHLAAGRSLEMDLRRPGSDMFENLLRHAGVEARLSRDDDKDADELTRRIARQMRAAGKSQPVARLSFAAASRVASSAFQAPGDAGEASVAALAATLIPGSDLVLENVALNPGRAGFFAALRRMGADLEVTQRRERGGEAWGTLRVRHSGLFGKRFDAETLGDLRDEVFLLLLAAAFAEGESVFRDLGFLAGRSADYLKSFVAALKDAGSEIGEIENGLVLRGKSEYDGGAYDALGHPGLAAAYAVLALKSHGTSTLRDAAALEWRYPGLLDKLDAAASDKAGEKTA